MLKEEIPFFSTSARRVRRLRASIPRRRLRQPTPLILLLLGPRARPRARPRAPRARLPHRRTHHGLLPNGRLPRNHNLARPRPNLVHRQPRLAHPPCGQRAPTRNRRRHAREGGRQPRHQQVPPRIIAIATVIMILVVVVVVAVVMGRRKVRRLKVRDPRRRQPLLTAVEHLVGLEVRQSVDAVVRMGHGLARRLLRARGATTTAAAATRRPTTPPQATVAVARVVAGIAVAAVAGLDEAGEHVGEQGAQRDDARANDAHVDLDDAVVGHGGAVPRVVEGQGRFLDGEDTRDGYGAGAVPYIKISK